MISVGVDIGHYSIKIAEVEATSKAYAIRRVQEIPLSLDPNKDRKIQVIDALRTLLTQYDLERTSFVFGISQQNVSARLIHLPFRERFKVQKAIISQLEDELPFSPEDSIFEAKIVRFQGKGADILAMAVPKEKVNDVHQLALDCGVDPTIISCTGVAINNLFERWFEPPPEGLPELQDIPEAKTAELVLNIGHLSSELIVMSNGAMLAARSLDWGGKNMADAISHKYGLNFMQAVKELEAKGFVLLDKTQGTREQQVFSQVIESSLQQLVADMRLILLELQSDLQVQWTKGHILGGGGQLKNLNGYLTQMFQIPFNRYKQFENHPAVTFDVSPRLDMVTATAVGLAIEGIKRPRNPASNFLKGDLAKKSHFFEAVWDRWGYTIKVATAGFVIFFIYAVIRESLSLTLLDESERALKTQAQAVAGLPSRQANASRIRRFISGQEQIEKNRKQAEKVLRLNSALDVLEAVTAALPPKGTPKFEIKQFSVRGHEAEVHGYTMSDFDKETVARALQKAAVNGKIEPTQSRLKKVPPGRVPFAYKFRVQRMAGG